MTGAWRYKPTSSWFFFRKISSSFSPSICISRSDLAKVSSSSSLLSPAKSASTDCRMLSSFSLLWSTALARTTLRDIRSLQSACAVTVSVALWSSYFVLKSSAASLALWLAR